MINFEMLPDDKKPGTVIKVIGVGGAGGNAVAHMIDGGVQGVSFICANTDAQALVTSQAPTLIKLGHNGLGAGAKPEQGRLAAESARGEIRNALLGANMVFITAGMGGGTGTGAAPIVAEVAKELGILTVGVVTKPFEFEGARRMRMAEQGIQELSKHVHSLIVVLNENLYALMSEDATQEDCFKEADSVLHNACAGIAEIINVEGNVNVDFEDVKTIMSETGQAMMGTAVASGEHRAREAAAAAIACPLLEGVDLNGASGVLVNITAGRSLKMRETREIMDAIRGYASEDANIIFGTAYGENMGEELRVTVVATGLANTNSKPELRVVQSSGAHEQDMQRTVNGANDYRQFDTNGLSVAGGLVSSSNPGPAHAMGAPRLPEQPSVLRTRTPGTNFTTPSAPGTYSQDLYDVPAFLRRQAD